MNAAPCLGLSQAKTKTNQKLNTLQTEGLQHTYMFLCFCPKNMFYVFMFYASTSGFYVVFPSKFEAAGHNNIAILSICWTREGS